MNVVITDRRFTDREPYDEAVTAAGGDVVYADTTNETEVIEACRDATVVVTFKAPVTRSVFAAMERCRLVMRNGTGYDNVDVAAATDYGVPVSNVPGYATDEVAEHAITLLLAAAREVVAADRDVRESDGWGERPPVKPMMGGTFGVYGLGRIGRATLPIARGLDMEVLAHDPYLPDDLFEALGVERVSFEALLARADGVSIHAPLTAETRHAFSTEEFERMKDDAVLVNTARGPIVDEGALVEALEAGELLAAATDVFETEPPNETPALQSERVICSPHHGGKCERVNERCIRIGTAEIVRALEGQHLQNTVNPEVLQRGEQLLNPERDGWR